MVRIDGLNPEFAARISVLGNNDLAAIHLYNDDCIPELSTEDMDAYLKRLRELATLDVDDAEN